jgi:mannosyltransferase OCH1-like enzyme
MIPRRIIRGSHSLHFQDNLTRRCEAALMTLLPDWEHLHFDDFTQRDFVAERRPALLAVYDAFPRNIQRADFFRVLAVAELGGFYLDTDVLLFQRLDDLCGASLVFPYEHDFTPAKHAARHRVAASLPAELAQIGNYGFGACAGHWFLEAVLDEIVERSQDLTARTHPVDVLWSTGPDCVNGVRNRHADRLRNELVTLTGMPSEAELASCEWQPSGAPHWYHFGRYGTHLMAGSWWKNP